MRNIVIVALATILISASLASAADRVWVRVRLVAANAAPTTQPASAADGTTLDSRFIADVSAPFDVQYSSGGRTFAANGRIETREDGRYRVQIQVASTQGGSNQPQLVSASSLNTRIDATLNKEIPLGGMKGSTWYIRISAVDPKADAHP